MGETLDEQERFAKLREAQGKEPKMEKGEETRKAKDNKMLGFFVESVIGQIRCLETALGEYMFLKLEVPMADGRKFILELKPQEEKQNGH